MTREEALNKAINIVSYFEAHFAKSKEAREDAVNIIEALEQEPCEDAISRQAVLEAIDVKAWEFCDYLISKNRNDEQKPVSHFADNLRECVREELPSVNPQERTGYWIRFKEFENGYYHIKCSECGQYWSIDGHAKIFKYCFNCGAKMEVEQNG